MDIVISWVLAHWADILAIYGGLVAAATVVVKLTPSQEDDAVLAKIVSVANWLSTVNPKK